MTVLLTALSALEVLSLAGALVYFLTRIVGTLGRIGGSADSYLAKIAFGVSAIERQTSHLAPQVSRLNRELAALADKLAVVDGHLEATARALGSPSPITHHPSPDEGSP